MSEAAFNVQAFLAAVAALLETALGVQESIVGEPDSFDARVSAYSAFGPITIEDEYAGGGLLFHVEIFAGFAYRVTGETALAEAVVAAATQDLIQKFYADRTLGDIIANGSLMFDLNSRPIYQTIDEQEHRLYLVRVIGDQRANIMSQ